MLPRPEYWGLARGRWHVRVGNGAPYAWHCHAYGRPAGRSGCGSSSNPRARRSTPSARANQAGSAPAAPSEQSPPRIPQPHPRMQCCTCTGTGKHRKPAVTRRWPPGCPPASAGAGDGAHARRSVRASGRRRKPGTRTRRLGAMAETTAENTQRSKKQ